MFQPMQRDAVRIRSNEKAGQSFGTGGKAMKFSGLQIKMWGKLFTVEVHHHGMDASALAFVRLYVWPVLVKVVRNYQRRCAPVVVFCGSTVDQHRPDRDLAS